MTPPAMHEGHFALESGHHTDRWFDLDALFADPASIAPRIERLAGLLATHAPDAICGPLTGGAFLAQAIAIHLGLRFLHAGRESAGAPSGLYPVRYGLSAIQRSLAAGRRVALVDDMIRAGSATRGTHAALVDAGAVVVAVGALFLSGDAAAPHWERLGVPLVAVERQPLALWAPDDCPRCRAGLPVSARSD